MQYIDDVYKKLNVFAQLKDPASVVKYALQNMEECNVLVLLKTFVRDLPLYSLATMVTEELVLEA